MEEQQIDKQKLQDIIAILYDLEPSQGRDIMLKEAQKGPEYFGALLNHWEKGFLLGVGQIDQLVEKSLPAQASIRFMSRREALVKTFYAASSGALLTLAAVGGLKGAFSNLEDKHYDEEMVRDMRRRMAETIHRVELRSQTGGEATIKPEDIPPPAPKLLEKYKKTADSLSKDYPRRSRGHLMVKIIEHPLLCLGFGALATAKTYLTFRNDSSSVAEQIDEHYKARMHVVLQDMADIYTHYLLPEIKKNRAQSR